MYLRYGDKQVLDDNYPAIQRWLAFLDSKSKDHVLEHYGAETWGFFADWVAPGRQIGGRWTNAVPKECDVFFNNCYAIENIAIAAKIAHILGKIDDAKHYDQEADLRRVAVDQRFYNKDREVYVNGEQAYQAIALLSDVCPVSRRPLLNAKLAQLIEEAQMGHLNTGVLGTFLMLQYLAKIHRDDLIDKMVGQRTFPGWGWMLDQGATTIGEQWGGRFSQVHTSFLSVNSWFIEGVGGIKPDESSPGYQHFIIRPAVVGDIASADTFFDSIHGRIANDWKVQDGRLRLDVIVPANTTATIYIPTTDAHTVTESGMSANQAAGVRAARNEKGLAVYDLVSGEYHFSARSVSNKSAVR
jgi:alpha-L-rhamnosidase